MRVLTTFASLLLLAGRFVAEVAACDYVTMRDAAFREPRDVHRLCVIARAGDETARRTHDRLARWLETDASGLNVELIPVAADDPGVDWREYGIASAPPSVPVVVLAGRRRLERKSFFIDYWEPAPTDQDLEILGSSPARERLRQLVGRSIAVLLHVPGTDGKSDAVGKAIDAVVRQWAGKERLGLSVVRVDRTDKRERVLLSFAGVEPTGPDWLAVVLGRGKFMPPLQGDEINEANLNEFIEIAMGECTCLRSPASLGVDIPMTWEKSLDAQVIPLLEAPGEASTRPMDVAPSATAPADGAASLPAGATGADTRPALGVDIPMAWDEVRETMRAVPAVPSPAEGSPPIDEPASGPRALATTMWTLGTLVLIVGTATAAILWRKHRR